MTRANTSNTGPTAVKAGRPSSTAQQPQPAADKSTTRQLRETDTLSQEVRMSDRDFNDGLKRAVQHVQQSASSIQPEAVAKSPAIQLSQPDTSTRPKRVKFATKRFIEQV